MHKGYVAEFIPKRHKMQNKDDVLLKFGITKNMDVKQRFNSYYEERYNDFDIKIKFSYAFETQAEAEDFERYWLEERYPNPGPNKVWVENYLGCENNRYDDTGITEIRLLKRSEVASVLSELYNSLSSKDKKFKAEAKLKYKKKHNV